VVAGEKGNFRSVLRKNFKKNNSAKVENHFAASCVEVKFAKTAERSAASE
jgi:hypothetical protein